MRPAPTPGTENLACVPIASEKRSGRTPFTSGTASYARSFPAPYEPVVDVTQTSALPDCVPFEVTTGDPDVYPKLSADCPARDNEGLFAASSPKRNTFSGF